MFVESNNKKDFAPLGATCGAAAYGAEARQESKFYKHSAPIGARISSSLKAAALNNGKKRASLVRPLTLGNLKRLPFRTASSNYL